MAVVTCKPSVRLKGLTPALLRILRGVYAVSAACSDVPEVVITSINDSTHGDKSRHYTNEAIDLRSKTFSPEAKTAFAVRLRAELGPQFTVLFEHSGTPNEHWHVQPRKGTTYAGPA